MANKLRNLGLSLSEGMMAFGQPDLYKDYMKRKEEEETRRAIAAKIQALQQGGGAGAGGLFPTGMSSEGKMSYGMLSPAEQRTEGFQRDIGAVTQAERLLKGRPTPATLQAMPRLEGLAGKERAKGILRSRLPQENVLRHGRATLKAHPGLTGKDWLRTEKGKYKEKKKEDEFLEKLPPITNEEIVTKKASWWKRTPQETKKRWTPNEWKVIRNINTKEDIIELRRDWQKYQVEDIDVQKIINWFYIPTGEFELTGEKGEVEKVMKGKLGTL